MGEEPERRAGLEGLARRLIAGWAILGGLVLVGVVLVNAYSIVAGAVINRPFPGDFELTEMGVAIAAFCFLPYCQLVGANVTADIFTSKAGPRAIALMRLLAALIAVAFAALLIWRMSDGLADYIEYPQTTTILRVPLWWAFVPALASLALLVLASLISLADQIRALRAAG
ncbi:MAG: TRAP transporter small permease subunit [Pseudomonadota bacterium]